MLGGDYGIATYITWCAISNLLHHPSLASIMHKLYLQWCSLWFLWDFVTSVPNLHKCFQSANSNCCMSSGVHCGCLYVLVLLFCFFFFQICQLLNSDDQLVSFCTSKTLSVIFNSSQMKVSHCSVHLAPKHVVCAVPTIVISFPSQ